jgi:quinol monooxygenase YgiN
MDQDVVVTMDIALKPENSERFAQMDKAGLEGTRNFSGCRGVQIVRHKDDANRFLFVERWESEQAYRDYIAWRTESGQFQALQQMAVSVDVDIWPQTVITV